MKYFKVFNPKAQIVGIVQEDNYKSFLSNGWQYQNESYTNIDSNDDFIALTFRGQIQNKLSDLIKKTTDTVKNTTDTVTTNISNSDTNIEKYIKVGITVFILGNLFKAIGGIFK